MRQEIKEDRWKGIGHIRQISKEVLTETEYSNASVRSGECPWRFERNNRWPYRLGICQKSVGKNGTMICMHFRGIIKKKEEYVRCSYWMRPKGTIKVVLEKDEAEG